MGSETRLRIVIEAARLFHEQGFAATAVADVLAAAEVRSGSLYHFFSSKTALLEAVLERHLELLLPTLLEPAEAATPDPLGRVFELLEHYRRTLAASGCTRGCPVGRLALEVGPDQDRARSLVDLYFARWADRVRSWLEAAGDRLGGEHDRLALARHVLAVMEGATMQAIAAGTLEPFDASIDGLRSRLRPLQSGTLRPRPAAAPHPPDGDANAPSLATAGTDDDGWRSW